MRAIAKSHMGRNLHEAYWVILGLYAMLTAAAFLLDSPRDIWEGLLRILTSRSILISDYAEIGSVGAMLISSVLVGLFSLIVLLLGGVKPTGATIVGIWLILGFGFFGKNLLNTIPITLGVFLYSRVRRIPFRDISLTTMVCATVAPIVSELAYLTPYPQPAGAIAGLLGGVFIGFIFPSVASAAAKIHSGFLLYNAGFAGGLIATFTASILRSAGFEIIPLQIWSTAYTLPLAILMYTIALAFILLGFFSGGAEKWGNFKKIHKHPGRLVTDFFTMYGNVTYLNMGILCVLSTTAVLLLGAPINGPVMGGIFCVVGFGALGKHVRNVVPIMIGASLSAFWNPNELTAPVNVLAILFGTGIAPLAGQFGFFWGVACGFVHVGIVSFVGYINGGLNLYNNGFAGGVVVIIMVPIIAALSRREQELA